MKQKLLMMLAALMLMGTSAMAQSETLKGDVNGDGVITNLDALMLLQAIHDKYNMNAEQFARADLDGNGKLVPTEKKSIGIGYFEWFACQQHGQVRMVVDPVTLADKGVTRVILRTAWSMTDLSTRINGGEETSQGSGVYKTQAFALYEIEESESSSEI